LNVVETSRLSMLDAEGKILCHGNYMIGKGRFQLQIIGDVQYFQVNFWQERVET